MGKWINDIVIQIVFDITVVDNPEGGSKDVSNVFTFATAQVTSWSIFDFNLDIGFVLLDEVFT